MDATQDTDVSAAIEFSKLTKTQKLAGLLLILDAENAAQLMAKLDEHELETVSAEMTKFTSLSQGLQQEILREFSGVAVEAASSISGGVARVKSLLEKSVGQFRASDIMGRVSPLRAPVPAMQPIAELDARHIFSLVRHEQLQTIALVTSYLPPDKAAQLLALLASDVREQVVERLATLAPTSLEVVESVAESLQRKLTNNRSRAMNQTGGIQVAADLLNALPKDISESILNSLRERNSDLGDAVLKKMFTFEELAKLDSRTLQKIMQEVDMRTLTVALKPATDALKQALLSTISKRAADNVREEISFLGPLKPAEIEAAQGQIIDTVRRLESEGEINLDEMRQTVRA